MRKWLNISPKESDYSADSDEDDSNDGDSDTEGQFGRLLHFNFYASAWLVRSFGFYYWTGVLNSENPIWDIGVIWKWFFAEFCHRERESRFRYDRGDDVYIDPNGNVCSLEFKFLVFNVLAFIDIVFGEFQFSSSSNSFRFLVFRF